MHLDLGRLNLLLTGKASSEERERMTDHLLECEACGLKFRAFNELHQHFEPVARRRFPWRYALGAAAVLFMTAYPYFSKIPGKNLGTEANLKVEPASSEESPRQLAVLERIQDINFQMGVREWGNKANLTDLVRLKNRQ